MNPKVITKPFVEIAPELLKQIKTQTDEVGQVTLHFIHYNMSYYPSKIRIWPTTFLFDHDSDHRSEMVHSEQISSFPEWTDVPPMSQDYFTLIFSGLPKGCDMFDFEEHCTSQGGEFVVRNIKRNKTDVYYLSIGI